MKKLKAPSITGVWKKFTLTFPDNSEGFLRSMEKQYKRSSQRTEIECDSFNHLIKLTEEELLLMSKEKWFLEVESTGEGAVTAEAKAKDSGYCI